ncbi:MAG: PhoD-like phosphatase N-terminal domain-containing protein, partial [Opitutales bacterium]|nr:PhoD-like phosphatase N-terminal domain-containing protein [Opitutales bacterium]
MSSNLATVDSMHLKDNQLLFSPALVFLAILLGFLSLSLTATAQQIHLGQGILAGEITDRQAILQARLTADTKLTDWELAGASGWGRFEYSEYPNFKNSTFTPWEKTVEKRDFILKAFLDNLKPNTIYHYRILYGGKRSDVQPSYSGSFRTHPGIANSTPLSLAFTTCVNHYKYYFGLGGKNAGAGEILPYTGPDKDLGYPGLKALEIASPDYVFFNGDTVYYDGPSLKYDLPKQ